MSAPAKRVSVDPALIDSKERVAALKSYHDQSGPYKHCVIEKLCDHEFLRKVHEELTTNMKATFKETDLFKVFQTPELGAVSAESLQQEMPSLLELRTILYSDNFRKIVQEILGCGELIDRVDCSSNAYANSCHLLTHDDVIGTRRVSYIIYLSDPDEEWRAEDGGAVELYPLEESSVVHYEDAGRQGVPVPMPTLSILPHFNQMLFFEVQPGRSYHSVQEVFAKDRPRLSISGWYHTANPPIGSDRSSLKQIMSTGNDTRPFEPISPELAPKNGEEGDNDADEEEDEVDELGLTEDDLTFLRQWISSEYLSLKGVQSIAKQFVRDSSVQLHNFLVKEKVRKLTHFHIQADDSQGFGKCRPQLDHAKGLSAQWQVLGPPHKRRYLTYKPSSEASEDTQSFAEKAGYELYTIAQQLFHSAAFARYLKAVTTLTVTGMRDEVRRFRSGFDYTVAHYGALTIDPRLDATLCFVNDDKAVEDKALGRKKKQIGGKKQKTNDGKSKKQVDEVSEEVDDGYDSDYAAVWEDGEVGGFECFIEADEEAETAEAAEVYRAETNKKTGEEEESTLLSVSPCNNSLSLVLRDAGIMKFIKYVSANAPGSRWDITAEYSIVKEDDDDNNDEDEDDDEDESENEEVMAEHSEENDDDENEQEEDENEEDQE